MEAIKNLLYRMADDALIIGHRNSEWTGLGPIIEEDIAFSSMAQDKIGHALGLYTILNEHFGEKEPDIIAFYRDEKDFKCCHFVELPIGEYDFSLMRHFLFDHAEFIRYQALSQSSFKPLAQLATKVTGEIKYHLLHANAWVKQLANGTEESKARLQQALNYAWPYALGMFESEPADEMLASEKVFPGEDVLFEQWQEAITSILEKNNLRPPSIGRDQAIVGGRKGLHTEHLKPLLDEMGEVIKSEAPGTDW